MGMIYACEHHDDVLALWRRQDLKGIRLAHVDFHDDLQGLIVNRRRGLAFARNSLLKAKVHPGNFLAKAVVERRTRCDGCMTSLADEVGILAWSNTQAIRPSCSNASGTVYRA